MEALVFFIFFGLYICIRVLLGGGDSAWDKQQKVHKFGLQLYRNQQFEEAQTYFERVHKRRPFEALPLVILGEIALKCDNPEQALAHGQRALRVDNSVAEAHLLMSKGLHAVGEFEEAFKMAKSAVWFGRNQEEVNWWFASLLLAKGELDESILYVEKACQRGNQLSWTQMLKDRLSKVLPV